MIGRIVGFGLGWVRSKDAWIIIGLVALSVVLWVVGPIVAIGSWMPLAPIGSRVIAIAALFGLYLLLRALAYWRSHAINQRLLGLLAEARDARTDKSADEQGEESAFLRRRFDEAMAVLKTARYDEASGVAGFFRRKQYVYELPWYMLIGAPGAGKTTLLANSGLEFPLAGKLGKAAVRGLGGTRNCDWWFTDQAVLIDTAGRYTTHESDAESDRLEWARFLALLRKYRPRQPINGALVAVSVSDLLSLDGDGRRNYANQVRGRLDEARQSFGMDFTVYCVVTKCDLLAGFAEFFAGLDREGRSQVWGFTLPVEEMAGSVDPRGRADGELQLLQRRLHDGLVQVLQHEPDATRRALCYGLPQQFAGLVELLVEFFEAIAQESRFSTRPQLRGLYFTSATQEGSPFDRVLSALDRGFQSNAAKHHRAGDAGHTYFIQQLLGKVVFAEAHLAGANRRQDKRMLRVRIASYALSAAALTAAALGWATSYRNNSIYIAEVEAKAALLANEVAALPAIPVAARLTTLLPLLDKAERVADGAAFRHDAPLFPWRWGLYQGDKLHAAAELVYRRLLQESFAAALHMRLEELLRRMQVDDLDFAFETLRAYLMLHDPDRFDAAELAAFMLADWDRNMPEGSGTTERQSYGRHLAKYAESGGGKLPPLNQGLVQDARSRLAQYSLSQRVYSRLKRQLNENMLPVFSLAGAAGERAASVFRRASGKALTDGVPSLYTYRGYHELFVPELDSTFAMLDKDEAWVLGRAEDPPARMLQDRMSAAFAFEVKRLYLHDYVLQWERFLDDVKLVRPDSLLDSVHLARTLGSPDSPMALFVRAAARETRLSKAGAEPTSSGSLLDQMKNTVHSTRDDLGRIVGPSLMPGRTQPRDKPELIVDTRFEALHRLANGSGPGSAPIDSTVQSVNELYSLLAATEAARQAGARPPSSDLPQRLRADAVRLPQPLRRIVEELAQAGQMQLAREAREARSGELVGNVGRLCEQTISGRYPFVADSSREVMPEDFSRIFGPNGKFDEYFRSNLADMVNVSTRPWTLRRGAQGDLGPGTSIAAFEKAATIREVFFRTGDGIPRISLTLKPVEMDASIISFAMDVDGQILRYQHGPQVGKTVTWPGPRGSQQVRVMLEPALAGRRSGLAADGPWALHRLFDGAQIVKGESPERFTVTFDIGGRKVTLEAVASSVHNPFRMQEISTFRCPVAL